MKRSFCNSCIGLGACIIMLQGCASHVDDGKGKRAANSVTPSTVTSTNTSGSSIDARGNPDHRDLLQAAASKPSAPFEGEVWTDLFDGKTLKGWKQTDFVGHGKVTCELGLIVFAAGDPFTGLNWTDSIPHINYEVALDAMRVGGSDFFCGLTIPVKDSCCSLITGGWGGSLVGI